MTSTSMSDSEARLSPSYNLPTAVIGLGAVAVWWLPWLGILLALFGLFLLLQAATIRLAFTETALEVYRSDRQIRRFPYQDWQNWQIFWPRVPILFYFKEVKSIHFLPVLFSPRQLQQALETHLTDLKRSPS
ncbi:MAG: DUF3119 family protein [Leptolyngbyaceae cyanobacterium SM1_1_3]|nr:DUF3119 family protein [Leptolyngbyaceae cyanobacterium SM1_1_3]NJN01048.1 DUF3119 family protein [Leptolyngbyaceae cyanobacterium RM1_1_2]NJO11507.1 DUF3119 family protein [Leptolyngbyaceae cyanobacterium SL_1_1]